VRSAYRKSIIWNSWIYVRFEILTAVVVKSSVFWDVTLCSSLKVNRRFGVTYYHHIQSRNKIQLVSRWQVDLCMTYSSTLNSETKCCSKTSGDFQRFNGVISQKIEPLMNIFLKYYIKESRGKFVEYEFSSGTQCRVSRSCCLLHADFLLGLLFHHEDGGYVFLRNFG
jgi:hypothetical protein